MTIKNSVFSVVLGLGILCAQAAVAAPEPFVPSRDDVYPFQEFGTTYYRVAPIGLGRLFLQGSDERDSEVLDGVTDLDVLRQFYRERARQWCKAYGLSEPYYIIWQPLTVDLVQSLGGSPWENPPYVAYPALEGALEKSQVQFANGEVPRQLMVFTELNCTK